MTVSMVLRQLILRGLEAVGAGVRPPKLEDASSDALEPSHGPSVDERTVRPPLHGKRIHRAPTDGERVMGEGAHLGNDVPALAPTGLTVEQERENDRVQALIEQPVTTSEEKGVEPTDGDVTADDLEAMLEGTGGPL
jgi:hypothetical protein